MFERKGIYKVSADKINLDAVELDLIDAGAEDVYTDDGTVYIETSFNDFGNMQKKLDELNIEINGAELLRIPLNKNAVTPEIEKQVNALIEKIEEDEDVVNVFHNMEETA